MAVSMSCAGGGANQQGGGATALAARHDHLVGILGGMGPAATADFYAKLIRRTPAARDQDHLRVVIWADPTIPDRSAAVIDGSTDPYPAILDGANRLRDLGATLVAMPCNTAHVFLPNLVRDTGLRFIDMVLETVTALTRREESVTTVGLLGTRGTIHSGLYQGRLQEAHVDTVVPPERMQENVDLAIRKVKQGDLKAGGAHLETVLGGMVEAGVSIVILACTELPLAAQHASAHHHLELLDPTDLLADAVVRACLS